MDRLDIDLGDVAGTPTNPESIPEDGYLTSSLDHSTSAPAGYLPLAMFHGAGSLCTASAKGSRRGAV